MRLIQYDDDRTINVQGIDNHQVPQLRLGKLGAVAKAKHGDVEVLLIFSQYAHLQRGKSIHSSLQLDDNNVVVNDRPIHLRGNQSLVVLTKDMSFPWISKEAWLPQDSTVYK